MKKRVSIRSVLIRDELTELMRETFTQLSKSLSFALNRIKKV